jgi:hypothetical protein
MCKVCCTDDKGQLPITTMRYNNTANSQRNRHIILHVCSFMSGGLFDNKNGNLCSIFFTCSLCNFAYITGHDVHLFIDTNLMQHMQIYCHKANQTTDSLPHSTVMNKQFLCLNKNTPFQTNLKQKL